jgi:hypothetical protein
MAGLLSSTPRAVSVAFDEETGVGVVSAEVAGGETVVGEGALRVAMSGSLMVG